MGRILSLSCLETFHVGFLDGELETFRLQLYKAHRLPSTGNVQCEDCFCETAQSVSKKLRAEVAFCGVETSPSCLRNGRRVRMFLYCLFFLDETRLTKSQLHNSQQVAEITQHFLHGWNSPINSRSSVAQKGLNKTTGCSACQQTSPTMEPSSTYARLKQHWSRPCL